MRVFQRSDESATELSSESGQVLEQGSRGFSTKAVMLSVCLATVVSATVSASATIAISRRPVASHATTNDGLQSITDNVLIESREAKKETKKIMPTAAKAKNEETKNPKAEWCALAKGENCMKSECCDNFGYQCYKKNTTYGACLKKCDPQQMAKDGNGAWSCTELGVRTRGAGSKENCLPYGFCADAGHQCYAKNRWWGQCMMNCDVAGMEATDKAKWDCTPIGPRNTADYRGDFLPQFTQVEPWVKNCAPLGQNCASTKCCAWTGYKCYEKNATWASCLRGCHPQKWNGGVSQVPIVQPGTPLTNPPRHWNVSFTPASPGPWTCKLLSPPSKFGRFNGSSLFCFSVALRDTGAPKKSEDVELLLMAQRMKTHVFACERWMVFSDVKMTLDTKAGGFVQVAYPKGIKRPNTKHYVNVPVFLNVWRAIKADTNWKSFPWIVKADPSTVFIPQRLREIVRRQVVTESGVYMENCKYVRMSFHGSLEVFSGMAFSKFLAHMEECQVQLPIHNADHAHFKEYGEDKFAAWCMHVQGVDKVPSRQQVDTLPEGSIIHGLHIATSCPGHRTKFDLQNLKWQPNCAKTKTAGLFAFRKPALWAKCFHETMKLG